MKIPLKRHRLMVNNTGKVITCLKIDHRVTTSMVCGNNGGCVFDVMKFWGRLVCSVDRAKKQS